MNIRLQGLFGLIAISSAMTASVAQPDMRVSFDEGAPKDRFRVENTGACAITGSSITLDLSGSRGGLYFDVTSRGEGVEVFQPFELVDGADALDGIPTVVDGQKEVKLDILSLAPDETIAFTIDVDDAHGQRAITVSGTEIEGAVVTYSHDAVETSATFSAGSEAEVPIASC